MSEQRHTPDMYIVMLRDASGQIAAAFPERNPEQLSDHRVGHEPASEVIVVPAETAASAIDLLAACEAALAGWRRAQIGGYLDNGGPGVPGIPDPGWPEWMHSLDEQIRAAISKARAGSGADDAR